MNGLKLRIERGEAKRLLNIAGMFGSVRILVIGDVMLDEYIWGKVTRISPEAPVPVVNVHNESFMPGGAANVAINIRALGAEADIAGFAGNDLSGKRLISLLKQAGINTKGIAGSRGNSTILKTRVIAHSQQVVRIDREKQTMPSADNTRRLKRYIKNRISCTDGVIVEDYDKGTVTQDLLDFLKDICRKEKKTLVVDPKKGHFLDYGGVTCLTPNVEELFTAAGCKYDGEFSQERVEDAGRRVMDIWPVGSLLITLGEHGMSLFENGSSVFNIPAMAKEVYDVSGAGDTVAGVFTAALSCGANTKEAAVLSNIAAGIVVGKVGTAVVTKKELADVIKSGIV